MEETISNQKDLANLYYNLYNGCIKFKNDNKKPNKDIKNKRKMIEQINSQL